MFLRNIPGLAFALVRRGAIHHRFLADVDDCLARSSSFDRFSHAIAVYRVARREAVALEHERVEMQFPRPFDLGVRGFEQVDRDLAWTFDFFVFSRIGRLSARLSSCCHAESGKGGFPNECSSWC